MTEIWNKEAEYTVRSKDEKFKIFIEFWGFPEGKGATIEIINKKNDLLHFFSVLLEKDEQRLDIEG